MNKLALNRKNLSLVSDDRTLSYHVAAVGALFVDGGSSEEQKDNASAFLSEAAKQALTMPLRMNSLYPRVIATEVGKVLHSKDEEQRKNVWLFLNRYIENLRDCRLENNPLELARIADLFVNMWYKAPVMGGATSEKPVFEPWQDGILAVAERIVQGKLAPTGVDEEPVQIQLGSAEESGLIANLASLLLRVSQDPTIRRSAEALLRRVRDKTNLSADMNLKALFNHANAQAKLIPALESEIVDRRLVGRGLSALIEIAGYVKHHELPDDIKLLGLLVNALGKPLIYASIVDSIEADNGDVDMAPPENWRADCIDLLIRVAKGQRTPTGQEPVRIEAFTFDEKVNLKRLSLTINAISLLLDADVDDESKTVALEFMDRVIVHIDPLLTEAIDNGQFGNEQMDWLGLLCNAAGKTLGCSAATNAQRHNALRFLLRVATYLQDIELSPNYVVALRIGNALLNTMEHTALIAELDESLRNNARKNCLDLIFRLAMGRCSPLTAIDPAEKTIFLANDASGLSFTANIVAKLLEQPDRQADYPQALRQLRRIMSSFDTLPLNNNFRDLTHLANAAAKILECSQSSAEDIRAAVALLLKIAKHVKDLRLDCNRQSYALLVNALSKPLAHAATADQICADSNENWRENCHDLIIRIVKEQGENGLNADFGTGQSRRLAQSLFAFSVSKLIIQDNVDPTTCKNAKALLDSLAGKVDNDFLKECNLTSLSRMLGACSRNYSSKHCQAAVALLAKHISTLTNETLDTANGVTIGLFLVYSGRIFGSDFGAGKRVAQYVLATELERFSSGELSLILRGLVTSTDQTSEVNQARQKVAEYLDGMLEQMPPPELAEIGLRCSNLAQKTVCRNLCRRIIEMFNFSIIDMQRNDEWDKIDTATIGKILKMADKAELKIQLDASLTPIIRRFQARIHHPHDNLRGENLADLAYFAHGVTMIFKDDELARHKTIAIPFLANDLMPVLRRKLGMQKNAAILDDDADALFIGNGEEEQSSVPDNNSTLTPAFTSYLILRACFSLYGNINVKLRDAERKQINIAMREEIKAFSDALWKRDKEGILLAPQAKSARLIGFYEGYENQATLLDQYVEDEEEMLAIKLESSGENNHSLEAAIKLMYDATSRGECLPIIGYDDDGNPRYLGVVKIPIVDIDGNPVLDDKGNPRFEEIFSLFAALTLNKVPQYKVVLPPNATANTFARIILVDGRQIRIGHIFGNSSNPGVEVTHVDGLAVERQKAPAVYGVPIEHTITSSNATKVMAWLLPSRARKAGSGNSFMNSHGPESFFDSHRKNLEKEGMSIATHDHVFVDKAELLAVDYERLQDFLIHKDGDPGKPVYLTLGDGHGIVTDEFIARMSALRVAREIRKKYPQHYHGRDYARGFSAQLLRQYDYDEAVVNEIVAEFKLLLEREIAIADKHNIDIKQHFTEDLIHRCLSSGLTRGNASIAISSSGPDIFLPKSKSNNVENYPEIELNIGDSAWEKLTTYWRETYTQKKGVAPTTPFMLSPPDDDKQWGNYPFFKEQIEQWIDADDWESIYRCIDRAVDSPGNTCFLMRPPYLNRGVRVIRPEHVKTVEDGDITAQYLSESDTVQHRTFMAAFFEEGNALSVDKIFSMMAKGQLTPVKRSELPAAYRDYDILMPEGDVKTKSDVIGEKIKLLESSLARVQTQVERDGDVGVKEEIAFLEKDIADLGEQIETLSENATIAFDQSVEANKARLKAVQEKLAAIAAGKTVAPFAASDIEASEPPIGKHFTIVVVSMASEIYLDNDRIAAPESIVKSLNGDFDGDNLIGVMTLDAEVRDPHAAVIDTEAMDARKIVKIKRERYPVAAKFFESQMREHLTLPMKLKPSKSLESAFQTREGLKKKTVEAIRRLLAGGEGEFAVLIQEAEAQLENMQGAKAKKRVEAFLADFKEWEQQTEKRDELRERLQGRIERIGERQVYWWGAVEEYLQSRLQLVEKFDLAQEKFFFVSPQRRSPLAKKIVAGIFNGPEVETHRMIKRFLNEENEDGDAEEIIIENLTALRENVEVASVQQNITTFLDSFAAWRNADDTTVSARKNLALTLHCKPEAISDDLLAAYGAADYTDKAKAHGPCWTALRALPSRIWEIPDNWKGHEDAKIAGWMIEAGIYIGTDITKLGRNAAQLWKEINARLTKIFFEERVPHEIPYRNRRLRRLIEQGFDPDSTIASCRYWDDANGCWRPVNLAAGIFIETIKHFKQHERFRDWVFAGSRVSASRAWVSWPVPDELTLSPQSRKLILNDSDTLTRITTAFARFTAGGRRIRINENQMIDNANDLLTQLFQIANEKNYLNECEAVPGLLRVTFAYEVDIPGETGDGEKWMGRTADFLLQCNKKGEIVRAQQAPDKETLAQIYGWADIDADYEKFQRRAGKPEAPRYLKQWEVDEDGVPIISPSRQTIEPWNLKQQTPDKPFLKLDWLRLRKKAVSYKWVGDAWGRVHVIEEMPTVKKSGGVDTRRRHGHPCCTGGLKCGPGGKMFWHTAVSKLFNDAMDINLLSDRYSSYADRSATQLDYYFGIIVTALGPSEKLGVEGVILRNDFKLPNVESVEERVAAYKSGQSNVRTKGGDVLDSDDEADNEKKKRTIRWALPQKLLVSDVLQAAFAAEAGDDYASIEDIFRKLASREDAPTIFGKGIRTADGEFIDSPGQLLDYLVGQANKGKKGSRQELSKVVSGILKIPLKIRQGKEERHWDFILRCNRASWECGEIYRVFSAPRLSESLNALFGRSEFPRFVEETEKKKGSLEVNEDVAYYTIDFGYPENAEKTLDEITPSHDFSMDDPEKFSERLQSGETFVVAVDFRGRILLSKQPLNAQLFEHGKPSAPTTAVCMAGGWPVSMAGTLRWNKENKGFVVNNNCPAYAAYDHREPAHLDALAAHLRKALRIFLNLNDANGQITIEREWLTKDRFEYWDNIQTGTMTKRRGKRKKGFNPDKAYGEKLEGAQEMFYQSGDARPMEESLIMTVSSTLKNAWQVTLSTAPLTAISLGIAAITQTAAATKSQLTLDRLLRDEAIDIDAFDEEWLDDNKTIAVWRGRLVKLAQALRDGQPSLTHADIGVIGKVIGALVKMAGKATADEPALRAGISALLAQLAPDKDQPGIHVLPHDVAALVRLGGVLRDASMMDDADVSAQAEAALVRIVRLIEASDLQALTDDVLLVSVQLLDGMLCDTRYADDAHDGCRAALCKLALYVSQADSFSDRFSEDTRKTLFIAVAPVSDDAKYGADIRRALEYAAYVFNDPPVEPEMAAQCYVAATVRRLSREAAATEYAAVWETAEETPEGLAEAAKTHSQTLHEPIDRLRLARVVGAAAADKAPFEQFRPASLIAIAKGADQLVDYPQCEESIRGDCLVNLAGMLTRFLRTQTLFQQCSSGELQRLIRFAAKRIDHPLYGAKFREVVSGFAVRVARMSFEELGNDAAALAELVTAFAALRAHAGCTDRQHAACKQAIFHVTERMSRQPPEEHMDFGHDMDFLSSIAMSAHQQRERLIEIADAQPEYSLDHLFSRLANAVQQNATERGALTPRAAANFLIAFGALPKDKVRSPHRNAMLAILGKPADGSAKLGDDFVTIADFCVACSAATLNDIAGAQCRRTLEKAARRVANANWTSLTPLALNTKAREAMLEVFESMTADPTFNHVKEECEKAIGRLQGVVTRKKTKAERTKPEKQWERGSATGASSSTIPAKKSAAAKSIAAFKPKRIDGVTLTRTSLESLRPGQYVTDEVILFDYTRLRKQYPDSRFVSPAESFLVANGDLQRRDLEYLVNYLHDGKLVFFPVNDFRVRKDLKEGGTHWTLFVAEVAEGRPPVLHYFDSLNRQVGATENQYAENIKRLLGAQTCVIQRHRMPQQQRADCALYLLGASDFIARKRHINPDFAIGNITEKDIKPPVAQMRQQLTNDIIDADELEVAVEKDAKADNSATTKISPKKVDAAIQAMQSAFLLDHDANFSTATATALQQSRIEQWGGVYEFIDKNTLDALFASSVSAEQFHYYLQESWRSSAHYDSAAGEVLLQSIDAETEIPGDRQDAFVVCGERYFSAYQGTAGWMLVGMKDGSREEFPLANLLASESRTESVQLITLPRAWAVAQAGNDVIAHNGKLAERRQARLALEKSAGASVSMAPSQVLAIDAESGEQYYDFVPWAFDFMTFDIGDLKPDSHYRVCFNEVADAIVELRRPPLVPLREQIKLISVLSITAQWEVDKDRIERLEWALLLLLDGLSSPERRPEVLEFSLDLKRLCTFAGALRSDFLLDHESLAPYARNLLSRMIEATLPANLHLQMLANEELEILLETLDALLDDERFLPPEGVTDFHQHCRELLLEAAKQLGNPEIGVQFSASVLIAAADRLASYAADHDFGSALDWALIGVRANALTAAGAAMVAHDLVDFRNGDAGLPQPVSFGLVQWPEGFEPRYTRLGQVDGSTIVVYTDNHQQTQSVAPADFVQAQIDRFGKRRGSWPWSTKNAAENLRIALRQVEVLSFDENFHNILEERFGDLDDAGHCETAYQYVAALSLQARRIATQKTNIDRWKTNKIDLYDLAERAGRAARAIRSTARRRELADIAAILAASNAKFSNFTLKNLLETLAAIDALAKHPDGNVDLFVRDDCLSALSAAARHIAQRTFPIPTPQQANEVIRLCREWIDDATHGKNFLDAIGAFAGWVNKAFAGSENKKSAKQLVDDKTTLSHLALIFDELRHHPHCNAGQSKACDSAIVKIGDRLSKGDSVIGASLQAKVEAAKKRLLQKDTASTTSSSIAESLTAVSAKGEQSAGKIAADDDADSLAGDKRRPVVSWKNVKRLAIGLGIFAGHAILRNMSQAHNGAMGPGWNEPDRFFIWPDMPPEESPATGLQSLLDSILQPLPSTEPGPLEHLAAEMATVFGHPLHDESFTTYFADRADSEFIHSAVAQYLQRQVPGFSAEICSDDSGDLAKWTVVEAMEEVVAEIGEETLWSAYFHGDPAALQQLDAALAKVFPQQVTAKAWEARDTLPGERLFVFGQPMAHTFLMEMLIGAAQIRSPEVLKDDLGLSLAQLEIMAKNARRVREIVGEKTFDAIFYNDKLDAEARKQSLRTVLNAVRTSFRRRGKEHAGFVDDLQLSSAQIEAWGRPESPIDPDKKLSPAGKNDLFRRDKTEPAADHFDAVTSIQEIRSAFSTLLPPMDDARWESAFNALRHWQADNAQDLEMHAELADESDERHAEKRKNESLTPLVTEGEAINSATMSTIDAATADASAADDAPYLLTAAYPIAEEANAKTLQAFEKQLKETKAALPPAAQALVDAQVDMLSPWLQQPALRKRCVADAKTALTGGQPLAALHAMLINVGDHRFAQGQPSAAQLLAWNIGKFRLDTVARIAASLGDDDIAALARKQRAHRFLPLPGMPDDGPDIDVDVALSEKGISLVHALEQGDTGRAGELIAEIGAAIEHAEWPTLAESLADDAAWREFLEAEYGDEIAAAGAAHKALLEAMRTEPTWNRDSKMLWHALQHDLHTVTGGETHEESWSQVMAELDADDAACLTAVRDYFRDSGEALPDNLQQAYSAAVIGASKHLRLADREKRIGLTTQQLREHNLISQNQVPQLRARYDGTHQRLLSTLTTEEQFTVMAGNYRLEELTGKSIYGRPRSILRGEDGKVQRMLVQLEGSRRPPRMVLVPIEWIDNQQRNSLQRLGKCGDLMTIQKANDAVQKTSRKSNWN